MKSLFEKIKASSVTITLVLRSQHVWKQKAYAPSVLTVVRDILGSYPKLMTRLNDALFQVSTSHINVYTTMLLLKCLAIKQVTGSSVAQKYANAAQTFSNTTKEFTIEHYMRYTFYFT